MTKVRVGEKEKENRLKMERKLKLIEILKERDEKRVVKVEKERKENKVERNESEGKIEKNEEKRKWIIKKTKINRNLKRKKKDKRKICTSRKWKKRK